MPDMPDLQIDGQVRTVTLRTVGDALVRVSLEGRQELSPPSVAHVPVRDTRYRRPITRPRCRNSRRTAAHLWHEIIPATNAKR
jgi:hypothetical protein